MTTACYQKVSAINLAGLFAVMLLVEPWSHTYRKLVQVALAQPQPDTTFAWLVRYPRLPALGGMLVYSGLVTLFGEELFFRGWAASRTKSIWPSLISATVSNFVLVAWIV